MIWLSQNSFNQSHLNTQCISITVCMVDVMSLFCSSNYIIYIEKKRAKKDYWGCKTILQKMKTYHCNISMCWIEVTVVHWHLWPTTRFTQVFNELLINSIRDLHAGQVMTSESIPNRQYLFQGDFFSPKLFFYLATNPLFFYLNREDGYHAGSPQHLSLTYFTWIILNILPKENPISKCVINLRGSSKTSCQQNTCAIWREFGGHSAILRTKSKL